MIRPATSSMNELLQRTEVGFYGHVPVGKENTSGCNLAGFRAPGRKVPRAGTGMEIEQVASAGHFHGIDRTLETGVHFNRHSPVITRHKINPDRPVTPARGGNALRKSNHFSPPGVMLVIECWQRF